MVGGPDPDVVPGDLPVAPADALMSMDPLTVGGVAVGGITGECAICGDSTSSGAGGSSGPVVDGDEQGAGGGVRFLRGLDAHVRIGKRWRCGNSRSCGEQSSLPGNDDENGQGCDDGRPDRRVVMFKVVPPE